MYSHLYVYLKACMFTTIYIHIYIDLFYVAVCFLYSIHTYIYIYIIMHIIYTEDIPVESGALVARQTSRARQHATIIITCGGHVLMCEIQLWIFRSKCAVAKSKFGIVKYKLGIAIFS